MGDGFFIPVFFPPFPIYLTDIYAPFFFQTRKTPIYRSCDSAYIYGLTPRIYTMHTGAMLTHDPRAVQMFAEDKKVRKSETYCPGRPEANIVDPATRNAPIAVGGAAAARDAVPRAAAYDAVGAGIKTGGIFLR